MRFYLGISTKISQTNPKISPNDTEWKHLKKNPFKRAQQILLLNRSEADRRRFLIVSEVCIQVSVWCTKINPINSMGTGMVPNYPGVKCQLPVKVAELPSREHHSRLVPRKHFAINLNPARRQKTHTHIPNTHPPTPTIVKWRGMVGWGVGIRRDDPVPHLYANIDNVANRHESIPSRLTDNSNIRIRSCDELYSNRRFYFIFFKRKLRYGGHF